MNTMQKKGMLTIEQIMWIILVLLATFAIVLMITSGGNTAGELLSRIPNL